VAGQRSGDVAPAADAAESATRLARDWQG
jgi:hypothetical protein